MDVWVRFGCFMLRLWMCHGWLFYCWESFRYRLWVFVLGWLAIWMGKDGQESYQGKWKNGWTIEKKRKEKKRKKRKRKKKAVYASANFRGKLGEKGKKKKKPLFHCFVVLLLGFSEYIHLSIVSLSTICPLFIPFFFLSIKFTSFHCDLRSTHLCWSQHLVWWQSCFYSFILLFPFQLSSRYSVLFRFLSLSFPLYIIINPYYRYFSLFSASLAKPNVTPHNRQVSWVFCHSTCSVFYTLLKIVLLILYSAML